MQGPATYGVAHLLHLIPLEHDIVLRLFWISTIFILFYFTYLIQRQETGYNSYFFLCLLFLVLFLKENDFATLAALLFLLPGFYLLNYTPYAKAGALLLSFSLFSKVQTLIIIAPIFFFYVFNYYRTLQKPLPMPVLKELFFKVIIVLTPTLILLLLSMGMYNNFLDYYILVHQAHPITTPVLETVYHIFSFEYAYAGLFLLLYIGIGMSLLRILNKKFDIFSFIIGISLPVFFVKIFSTFGIFSGVGFYRYFSIFAPFYFILLYKLKEEIGKYSRTSKIISFLVIILLFFPFYQAFAGFTLDDVTDRSILNDAALVTKIQREVSYPFFLLNTSGQVLVSKEYNSSFGEGYPFLYILSHQFSNINPDATDPYAETRPDMSFAPQFIQIGIMPSLDGYNPDLHVNFTKYKEQLYAGAYPIIISRPYSDFLTSFLDVYSEYINSTYCGGYIPYLVGPYFPMHENYIIIYFNDLNMCREYSRTVISYYSTNFERLCSRSKAIGDTISAVLSKNHFSAEKECNSFSKTAEFITPTQIQQIYLALLIYVFLIIMITTALFIHQNLNKY